MITKSQWLHKYPLFGYLYAITLLTVVGGGSIATIVTFAWWMGWTDPVDHYDCSRVRNGDIHCTLWGRY